MKLLMCWALLLAALPADAAPRFEAKLPGGIAMQVAEFPVSSGAAADASVGAISYLRPGKDRPVLFAFNGGPGASSAFLHMGLLGPERAAVPQDPKAVLPAKAPLVANAESLLDVADIVLLDPPGTGFSELKPGTAPDFYRSVSGDADAVSQGALAWLAAHGRMGSPVYILGESYGTIRATAMVEALKKRDPALKLRGVLLLGQALNMIETSQRPGNVVTWPVNLPTLAAVSCWHRGCDPEKAAEAASAFGPAYLGGLYRGRELDATERARLAGQLAALTGLPADGWEARGLKLSKEQYRLELLHGEGRVLARYDARYTGTDPKGDAFTPVSNLFGAALTERFAKLGVPGDYKVLARTEGGWAYGGADSPFADWPFMQVIERAMAADPQFRLFIGTGLYDLTTTVGAADYLVAQTRADPARIVNRRYKAGHMTYSDDVARQTLSADIRAFLQAGAK
ncbi:S10 family serine carboxypeptidase-like protein [Sandaracinobacteroides hominis]|uniref:S10 family serine carboxypeptidase-like protein n=1 Tax=Sandaracinobacteroides hominis TaxID=2780086 RepID=UPI0018F564E6|nr:septum formation initiator [Sandaracinobacteroides hominis]